MTGLTQLSDFAAIGEFSVHPRGEHLAYVAPHEEVTAVWVTSLDDSERPRLLWAGEPVQRCVWRPDGRRILVQVDADGKENYQLGELDPASGTLQWLSIDAAARHEIGPPARTGNQPYASDSRLLAYASNARDRAVFDIVVHDLIDGQTRIVLRGDDRYFPVSFAPDGRRLLVLRMRQNTDHDLFVCDVRDGTVEHITPHDGPARYVPGPWSSDGRAIYAATTQGRDFAGLARIDASQHDAPRLRWLATPPYDIDYVTRSDSCLLWSGNRDGHTTLHLRELSAAPGRERVLRTPTAVLARDMGRGPYAPQFAGSTSIVTGVGTATMPTHLRRFWTDGRPDTTVTAHHLRVPDPENLVAPTVVRYPSTDGVVVPALLYQPRSATADAPAPVVVSIHGGPEVQALPVYSPLIQCLLQRGIGVIEPNYRGSSGYGLAYQRMIYRDFAGGDLRDLAKAVDYLRTVDWVDANRLGVYGVSYGGFAALSCLGRHPDLWCAGVEQCGRSDLTTAAVPPHWRSRMREWVGDIERDAELLRERSPITYVDDIDAPLLVIHGENDTRVPKTESDRVVQRLRELGKPVEYVVLAGDGHGSTSRRNRHAALTATVDWFDRHLHLNQ
ncbi:alpha/beta hydrolase family protein [Fodinicola acaciae]|uniref:alpha/beta hydrolase family protein n=1 Tax=Fodinicola acaciae TaxID=2681555 RepID=UPI0013D61262|nr:S9 family peptidase [Fodinicola acaciae]